MNPKRTQRSRERIAARLRFDFRRQPVAQHAFQDGADESQVSAFQIDAFWMSR